ncbi:Mss4-like protein [Rhexocercosporidium sp. MPI-PUGE-AT-0058]|nr:Mss4-like protein [Rhexocercosporidium sp. MPI-PUGE-AT-0058]
MSSDHGKCHCGQTEWDVKLNERAHILLGGGSYSLNQIVPKENLKIIKGDLKAYKYKGDSDQKISSITGKSVSCYYCPNCTSHAYHHQEVMGDNIVVRTGLLDSSKSLQPGAEIYGKARHPWVQEVAQTFDTMPPS